ncbi:response regulator transcription factor [Pedobacter sp. SYSU D00535]|uniref:response regulator n=1 Tax=Pedobacter sp. SYSU D00535 TaxID=2810308 RepID=UPI001A96C144|nr:response regulator transcription factor [Pedobacter sp. SYSU D00535]
MIKILVYEDNPQLREGLTLLLGGSENLKVVGAFANPANIVSDCASLAPDLILMDIDMPEVNGIEGLKRLREVNCSIKVLMLTVFDDNQRVFEALRSGANGYILKKTPPAKLLEYINDANSGGAPMSSTIATQVLQMFSSFSTPPAENEEDYNLSERETQVLQLLVNGYSYKMIASEMFISIDTVRSHIKKIYEKLHVNSKSEAVAKAFKGNLFR